jgi:Domain of unknown function (DUF6265)
MKKYACCLVFLITVQDLFAQTITDLTKTMGWLEGDWFAQSERGFLLECWQKKDDSTFMGITYYFPTNGTIKKEDITHNTMKNFGKVLEHIEIHKRGYIISYITTVNDQTKDAAIIFPLSASDSVTIIFENPAHDFPQKIVYKYFDAQHIEATISAQTAGGEIKEVFSYVKMNE